MIFGWKTKPEWISVYEKRAAERAARMEKLMKFKQMQYAISRQMYDPEMLAQRINPAPVEMDGRAIGDDDRSSGVAVSSPHGEYTQADTKTREFLPGVPRNR